MIVYQASCIVVAAGVVVAVVAVIRDGAEVAMVAAGSTTKMDFFGLNIEVVMEQCSNTIRISW
jgi:hypothetical protein